MSSERVSPDDELASSSLQRPGIGKPSRASATITVFSVGRNTCEGPSCSGHRHSSVAPTVPHFKADRSRATSGIGPTFQAKALLTMTPVTSTAVEAVRDHRIWRAPIAWSATTMIVTFIINPASSAAGAISAPIRQQSRYMPLSCRNHSTGSAGTKANQRNGAKSMLGSDTDMGSRNPARNPTRLHAQIATNPTATMRSSGIPA